jgi:hypothetical protein
VVTPVLNPGLSYIVSYAFNVPQSEAGGKLILKLLDAEAAAPYKLTIASIQAPLQKDTIASTVSLYPVDLHFEDWSVSTSYLATNLSYTYKIKLNLDLKQADNVVIDQGFSKLRFEVVDKLGRVLGTADSSFSGVQKLVSGTQTLVTSNIQSEQFEFPITVNVYELIETQNGQSKRFLKTLN